MSNQPKVSVLMPVYNGEKYLQKSIDSILNQSFTDFEFIIVDDGSTDATEYIVKNVKDPRIVYHKKAHSGLVDTLNFGLRMARATYVVRMDSDDISMPERLKRQYFFLSKNLDIAVLGTHATVIDEHDLVIDSYSYPPVSWEEIKRYAILHNPFIHPSVMFRREVIMKAGGYKPFKHVEDYELWTRIIFSHRVENLPEKLLQYRVHSDQVTNKHNKKMRISNIKVRLLVLLRSFLKV